ncbi:MAG: hypothetical protein ABIT20_13590 [Gemmatimonadaceae bacterium]
MPLVGTIGIALAAMLQTTECTLPSADSAWIASALDGWKRQSARVLGKEVRKYPTLVLFDERCTHTLTPTSRSARFVAGTKRFAVASIAHGDSIALPDGSRIPAALTSFASPQKDGTMSFVMALPSIWLTSSKGPRSDLLTTAVFMHEFTHTQNIALGQFVDTLVSRGLPEDSDDDVIQTKFGDRPGFTDAYSAERDVLYQAVAATSVGQARVLGAKALAMMDRRRAQNFRGADMIYAQTEDLFLSMEGAGQWFAYLWLVDPKGGAMTSAEALTFIRRGGRRWSQDEGLALLLLASRLSPSAPRALFASTPHTILPLLKCLTVR